MKVLGLPLDWSGIGAMVTACTAVLAVLIAKRELRLARENTAEEIYKEFLMQSLQHPEFICPDAKTVNPQHQRFNERENDFWRYEVYIDLMLTAFEELFMLEGADAKLEKYIGGYLYSHKKISHEQIF